MSSEWGACGNSGSMKSGNSRRHPNNGRNDFPPPKKKFKKVISSRDRRVARLWIVLPSRVVCAFCRTQEIKTRFQFQLN